MQIELNQLINETLGCLKKLGLKESTIKTYRYGAYSPIRKYCVQQGTTWYEPAILDLFLSYQKNALKAKRFRKIVTGGCVEAY